VGKLAGNLRCAVVGRRVVNANNFGDFAILVFIEGTQTISNDLSAIPDGNNDNCPHHTYLIS
jgi:hypothetical protein